MSLNKISDEVLNNEGRYHKNLPDVPGKSAEEMKEFMDYIPRRVIIPKINEVIDSVYSKDELDEKLDSYYTYDSVGLAERFNEKADKTAVYDKFEMDQKLDFKQNFGDCYTKEQSDNRYLKSGEFANALKAHKRSKTITLTDISPIGQGITVGLSLLDITGVLSELVNNYCVKCAFDNEQDIIAYLDSVSDWQDGKLYLYKGYVGSYDENDNYVLPDAPNAFLYIQKSESGYSLVEHTDGLWSDKTFSLSEWLQGYSELDASHHVSDMKVDITSHGRHLILGERAESDIKVMGKNLINLNAPFDITGTYSGWIINPTCESITLTLIDKNPSLPMGVCAMGLSGDVSFEKLLISSGEFDSAFASSKTGNKYIHKSDVRWNNKNNKRLQILFGDGSLQAFKERFDIQIEYGLTATEYEPYVEPTIVHITEEQPQNIEPLYPSTTLIAQGDVEMDITYNRDVNKAIASLEKAIIGLGGVIQ